MAQRPTTTVMTRPLLSDTDLFRPRRCPHHRYYA
jgi:hypothetical protein